MNTTEIVYVVSPSYGDQLFVSLYTLLQSGTTFDTVRVFCVGKRPKHWQFKDSRIIVDEVENLDLSYFPINKTYATQSKADRVIFLDSDTLIIKPLDSVWQGVDADFIARVDSFYYIKGSWKQDKWLEILEKVGASAKVPYFNSGFFICQNGAIQSFSPIWYELIRSGLKGELFDPSELQKTLRFERKWTCEQFALSLALGVTGLSYHAMDEKEHGFGWVGESYNDVVLYHTGGGGGGQFSKAAFLESETNQNFFSTVTVNRFNPTYLAIQWKLFNYKKWRILTKLFGFKEAERQIKAMLPMFFRR